jgi:hypothetical protein
LKNDQDEIDKLAKIKNVQEEKIKKEREDKIKKGKEEKIKKDKALLEKIKSKYSATDLRISTNPEDKFKEEFKNQLNLNLEKFANGPNQISDYKKNMGEIVEANTKYIKVDPKKISKIDIDNTQKFKRSNNFKPIDIFNNLEKKNEKGVTKVKVTKDVLNLLNDSSKFNENQFYKIDSLLNNLKSDRLLDTNRFPTTRRESYSKLHKFSLNHH